MTSTGSGERFCILIILICMCVCIKKLGKHLYKDSKLLKLLVSFLEICMSSLYSYTFLSDFFAPDKEEVDKTMLIILPFEFPKSFLNPSASLES